MKEAKKMIKMIKRIRFIFHAKKFIPFLYSYFMSSDVTKSKKITAVLLMVGYVIFPFDMIPDFLAFFGILDDVAVLTFVMQLIIKHAPQHLKDKFGIDE
jgi:uncharacterized membrane protein YkvA (DUF1232 family)